MDQGWKHRGLSIRNRNQLDGLQKRYYEKIDIGRLLELVEQVQDQEVPPLVLSRLDRVVFVPLVLSLRLQVVLGKVDPAYGLSQDAVVTPKQITH